jgi:broad specificity phosphatase PhoE/cobalamin synthase
MDIGNILFAAGATLIPLLLTGGIHMVGYCDCIDALSSRRDKKKMLEILKDPHIGAFAAIYCAAYLLAVFGLYSELGYAPLPAAVCCGFILSRALAVLSAVCTTSAGTTGFLVSFTRAAHKKSAIISMSLTALLSSAAMIMLRPLPGAAGVVFAIVAFFLYRNMAVRKFGGVTGDTTGYFIQICELAILTGVFSGKLISGGLGMNIIFVRHARTQGNLEKRYIGRTNEPLCDDGVKQAGALLGSGNLPRPDTLIVSPYLRCRQTAEILYPGAAYEINDDLRECDFGIFEGKTHNELLDNKEYTSWLETGCRRDIPGGESVGAFKQRCCLAFIETIRNKPDCATVVFIIHGGCIMAILEHFERPKKEFQEYYVNNCEVVVCFAACSQNDISNVRLHRAAGLTRQNTGSPS